MSPEIVERWYLAVLVFESSVTGSWDDPSVDLQYRLIRATDSETAYARANALGRHNTHQYSNPEGETVTWAFKGLADLDVILEDELQHGVEVYGFITEGSAADHVVDKDQLTLFRGRQDHHR